MWLKGKSEGANTIKNLGFLPTGRFFTSRLYHGVSTPQSSYPRFSFAPRNSLAMARPRSAARHSSWLSARRVTPFSRLATSWRQPPAASRAPKARGSARPGGRRFGGRVRPFKGTPKGLSRGSTTFFCFLCFFPAVGQSPGFGFGFATL